MDLMAMDLRSADRGYTFGYLTNPRGGDNLKNYSFCHWKMLGKGLVGLMTFDMFEDVKSKYINSPREKPVPPGKENQQWPSGLRTCTRSKCVRDLLFLGRSGSIRPGPSFWIVFCFYRHPNNSWGTDENWRKYFYGIKSIYGQGRFDEERWHVAGEIFTETPADGPNKGAVLSKEEIDKLLDEYYELRGWDKETSIPTNKKLAELGLV